LILDDIIQHKREEVARRKMETPLREIKAAIADAPTPLDLVNAVRRLPTEPMRVIAEVKKASPSKGVIREDFHPVQIARAYEAGGASAISVLTDEKFFQGSADYLVAVKSSVGLPVLRKDFTIDDYQVYESRAIGADAILLIAAALTDDELRRFQDTASELGMRCLVEVHDEREMDRAAAAHASLIGINNRDLRTFQVDIGATMRLAPATPAGCVLVSESGIHTRDDMQLLANTGAHAALTGECLMRAEDIGDKLRELIS
jgi:indole-3-glycerol phosphate synthase